MELALSLEKLNFHKLRELHDVADASQDAQMADFVEQMLAEQVQSDCSHSLSCCFVHSMMVLSDKATGLYNAVTLLACLCNSYTG